jgi:uncharacterized protein (TIGR02391 family)
VNQLATLVPDPNVFLALEQEEVGAVLLELLNGIPPSENRGFFNLTAFSSVAVNGYAPEFREQSAKRVAEGWVWLLREGFIAPRPDDNNGTWHFVTQRGEKLRTREHVASFARSSTLPKALLHPIVVAKAERAFMRGEYDTAVFQAFRELEVIVRAVGGFSDADFGAELMRKAFHEDRGPLTDLSLPISERQALAHLCAGAIGSYKNPHSHRNVRIDATEAAEMLVLASHLIRIVEQRAAAVRAVITD